MCVGVGSYSKLVGCSRVVVAVHTITMKKMKSSILTPLTRTGKQQTEIFLNEGN
jgi:hypothetical protein